MEEGIDALVTNVTQSSPSLNGPWGFLHALLPPFWSQQESSVDLSITGITMITILLQMFFSSLTIYVVVNIAIRCFSRFPFSEAARRQWLKDHDIHHRKDEDKRHYFSTKREIWKTIKLQISILFIVAIEVFGNVITKIYLFFYSFLFLILSKEHQEFEAYVTTAQYLWRPTSRPDPDLILCERSVVFMRHGESIWNLAFNRPISFWTPFRILYLLGWELLLGCERDSVILDSPLSSLGQYQAGSVLHWLQDEQFPTTKWSVPQGDHKTKSGESEKRYIQHKIINELNGNHEDRNCVIVVTSNLRRAISTALIAFNHRWNPSIDTASSILPCPKLYVHSFLQEATRNADGYSLRVSDFDSTQNAQPVSLFERNPLIMADRVIDISSSYASALDQSFDHGSKHMLTASLLQRLQSFANWLCDQNSPAAHTKTVIVVGHSIWFRKFFTLFLPPKSKLEVTRKKLPNCSMLRFNLIKYRTTSGSIDHWVDPASFVPIYGGFQGSQPLRSSPDGPILFAAR